MARKISPVEAILRASFALDGRTWGRSPQKTYWLNKSRGFLRELRKIGWVVVEKPVAKKVRK